MNIKSIIAIILLLFLVSCNSGGEKQGGPKNVTNPDVGNPFDPDAPTNCLAIDTDGDGLLDCLDPDKDGDGFANEVDAFPTDPTEWKDTDGDRVGDNSDVFPLDPEEWGDNDADGVGDNADEDDDNDGVPDEFEYIGLSFNQADWIDIDRDLIGKSIDEDDDNDGVPDQWDDLFWNKSGWFDIDGDLVPNSQDSDIDGDAVLNLTDAFPYDATEWLDTDSDRLGNNIDPDDDADGFPDSWEEYSTNVQYAFDTDGDGFANELDAFPYDANEWVDTDGDGVGDNSDVFPFDPSESKDTDLDGLGDNRDPDIDGDGFKNCIPVDLTGPASCNQDRFVLDRDEWVDADGDGVGDNSDEDDDNDSFPDVFDEFPKNRLHFHDFDKDGIPDSTFPGSTTDGSNPALLLEPGKIWFIYDEDVDNDGCPNMFDQLPYDSFDCFDLDGDRIGNNRDNDIDGDGITNDLDLFPYDNSEWGDNDLDTLGDTIDADDDNDGVPDLWDSLSLNGSGFSDYNGDGLPDQGSPDIDGDGFTNGNFDCFGQQTTKELNIKGNIITYKVRCLTSNPGVCEYFPDCNYPENHPQYSCSPDVVTVCGYPPVDPSNPEQRRDLYIWDHLESMDVDRDKLPDNLDEDDDNDGVPDLWDEFPVDNVSDKRFRWADLDKDGIADSTLFLDGSNWVYAFDNDIDGDGVDNGNSWSCNSTTDVPPKIICGFVKQYTTTIANPLAGIGANPSTIQVTFQSDFFPYNPTETSDTDRDGLGDNKDTDIDADGKFNCIPVNLDTLASCNQDALPTIGQNDAFVSEKYKIWNTNGPGAVVIQEIAYCASTADCYFKNYDRDNDGLTDYEEYLNYSNPLLADTDGDGVPDNVEVEQGTMPYDPSDFLDTDGDGIPDYLDKTPKGAFDENSLREQFVNASSCQNKQLEEVCIDDSTGLCYWSAGLCRSKEILITKDLNINDCFEITGEVSVRGNNRWTLNFTPAMETGARCSGSETVAITGTNESTISFNNLIFSSSSIDNLISTSGKSLKFKESAIMLQNTTTPKVIDMNNLTNGVLDLERVSIHSKINPLSTSPVLDDLSIFKADVRTLRLASTIVSCNVGSFVNSLSSYKCIDTNAGSSTFHYLTAVTDSIDSADINDLDSFTFKHNSTISSAFTGKNVFFSPLYATKVTGLGISYTAANILTNDLDAVDEPSPLGKFNVNGTKVSVTAQDKINNEEIFDTFPSPKLYCSTNDPDEVNVNDTRTINLNYFLPTPVDPLLTQRVINVFNSFATNLSPEGTFETEPDFQIWNNGMDTGDGRRFPPSSWDTTFGNNRALLLAGPTSFTGIGRFFTAASGIDITKKYQLEFNIAPENEIETDIQLDLLIFNKNTLAPIKIVKIRKRPYPTHPDEIVNELTNSIELFIDFNGQDVIKLPLRLNTVDFGIQIVNNTSAISRSVYIDNIKFLKAKEYSIQYPGVSMPFCE